MRNTAIRGHAVGEHVVERPWDGRSLCTVHALLGLHLVSQTLLGVVLVFEHVDHF